MFKYWKNMVPHKNINNDKTKTEIIKEKIQRDRKKEKGMKRLKYK